MMKCQEIENSMMDYLEGNLPEETMQQMEEHLRGCESCKRVLQETQILLTAMENTREMKPSAGVRQGFLEALEEEKGKQGKVRSLQAGSGGWKTAFQIAASILLVIAGYGIGTYTIGQESKGQIAQLEQETQQLKEDMLLAMIDNNSASKRIQAVSYSEDFSAPDDKVIQALIERLQFDPNVNVRLAAAEALSRYGEMEMVKDAFIYSLSNEKDPGIQIAVIEFLVDVKEERAKEPMEQLLDNEETPGFVKQQLNQGLKNLM